MELVSDFVVTWINLICGRLFAFLKKNVFFFFNVAFSAGRGRGCGGGGVFLLLIQVYLSYIFGFPRETNYFLQRLTYLLLELSKHSQVKLIEETES